MSPFRNGQVDSSDAGPSAPQVTTVSSQYAFDPRNIQVLREEFRPGGFGTVYKAFDMTTGVEETSRIYLAVKVLRGQVTDKIISDLRRVRPCCRCSPWLSRNVRETACMCTHQAFEIYTITADMAIYLDCVENIFSSVPKDICKSKY
jgi:hypothetical protein